MAKNDDSEQPRIHVESHGQQGGITAGIVNINGSIPARAEFSDIEHEQVPDGFVTRLRVTVRTEYSIPVLRIVTYSPTLTKMVVRLTGAGILALTSGEGTLNVESAPAQPARYSDIHNASGEYLIEAFTKDDEVVGLQVARP